MQSVAGEVVFLPLGMSSAENLLFLVLGNLILAVSLAVAVAVPPPKAVA